MTSDPFISYAQNREDVVLRRALTGISDGRYLDIGANDPTVDSVTKLFYDAGWSGITVDPVPAYAQLLRTERPRDTVFDVAVTATDGDEVVLHTFAGTGLSTLVDLFADRHVAAGHDVAAVRVSTRTLNSLLAEAEWAPEQPIHFIVVDVEGAEEAVLRGLDLSTWRPWILVVEATEPTSDRPTHDAWESLLTDAGYRFAQFDGLSRFYVADEKWDELHAAVERPASPLDGFIPYRVDALGGELTATAAERDEARADLDAVRTELDKARAELKEVRAELAAARVDFDKTHVELTTTRAELDAVVVERDHLAGDVATAAAAAVTASKEAAQARAVALRWRERAVGAWSARAAEGHTAVAAELARWRKHADLAERELSAMKETVSWRITRPLRMARARRRADS